MPSGAHTPIAPYRAPVMPSAALTMQQLTHLVAVGDQLLELLVHAPHVVGASLSERGLRFVDAHEDAIACRKYCGIRTNDQSLTPARGHLGC